MTAAAGRSSVCGLGARVLLRSRTPESIRPGRSRHRRSDHELVAGCRPHRSGSGRIHPARCQRIFVAIGSIIAAFICAAIAAAKGRNPFGWGLLGLFFSILTLIVVVVIPSKKS